MVGAPDWLAGIGVPTYDYIDNKPNSPTFGQTLQAPVTWSAPYVARLTSLVQQLGERYADDTTLVYVNAIAGRMNNNFPATVADGQAFYTATGYHPDTLLAKMKLVLDAYMAVFPNTPAWNSVENISFEIPASGRPNKWVADNYASYGVTNYPDRFGVWREDLSACTNLNTATGHWSIVAAHPCRNGAQMLWNVQDGPDRMNQCGAISPNTKSLVLEGAYTATYIAANGCDSTIVLTLNVGLPPVAGFNAAVSGASAGFTNTTANALFYSWDFGDGSGSTEANPVHPYAANGTYTVTLTAGNNCGTSTAQQTIRISTTAAGDFMTPAGMVVFPNPNRGVFSVQQDEITGDTTIECLLFDATRRLVRRQHSQGAAGTVRFDFSAATAGVYGLEIRLSTGRVFRTKLFLY